MPPSTVFSYWRRDHRRAAATPTSLPPGPSPANGPESPLTTLPQLPELPDTPNIEDAISFTPLHDAPPWSGSPLENDPSKLSLTFNTTATLSSSASLAVPCPLSEKEYRPHSSPEEYRPQDAVMSQKNNSQLSISGLRPDQGDGEPNSKAGSPFRLSFKGPRALQTEALENPEALAHRRPGIKSIPDQSIPRGIHERESNRVPKGN
ncbi:hypothetical protein N7470_000205 [Penicillium chermesinum]|nr:hypothetical protein N7470_000205 [Penicillium chermesinum]